MYSLQPQIVLGGTAQTTTLGTATAVQTGTPQRTVQGTTATSTAATVRYWVHLKTLLLQPCVYIYAHTHTQALVWVESSKGVSVLLSDGLGKTVNFWQYNITYKMWTLFVIREPELINIIIQWWTRGGLYFSEFRSEYLWRRIYFPFCFPSTSPACLHQETMENVKKCKNFLSTLIKLASSGKQSSETAANVKELVQNLLVRKAHMKVH